MKKKNNNIGKKALIVGVSTMMAGGTVLPVQAMEKGASDTEIHTTVVDKSHLQELYDQYSGYTCDCYWYEDFTKAYEKAGEILAKEDATEEEVTDAANELDQYYWLCKHGEKIKLYKFDENGQSEFDYASYTTESVVPIYKVFRESGNYGAHTDTELVKKAYNDFVEAEKGLVKTDDTNVMRGLTEDGVHIKNKGDFTVQQTDVFIDEENNTKVKLHVEYHNTGINPITGKDDGTFSSHDMDDFAEGLQYEYETYAGGAGIRPISDDDVKPLDGEKYFLKGFQCDVIVDPGTYQFNTGPYGDPSALGVFYTDTGEEQGVDKTKLQEVYDKYKDYESPYDNNWTAGSFETYVKKAEEVLQDANATKEQVDQAAYTLEQKWLACNIEDYRLKYSVSEDNFNRDDYTTESLIPVYKAVIPIRFVDTNAPVEELRAVYEPIAEAEKGLVKTDEHGLMRGIQKEIASESMSKVGEFVITEDENTAAKFHVEFHNTGIHPITGAEKQKFTEKEMKNPGLSVKIKGYDGKNMSTGISPTKLKPLDGETDFTKGFQVDYQGDIAGIYSFYIKPGYSNIPATGNYYSKDEVVNKSDLQDLVDDVKDYYRYTTVYLEEFKPALEKAQSVLAKEDATQDDVDTAFAALDKAYARCQIQDYILDYYYDADEIYENYTTDSAVSLYSLLSSAKTILDENKSTTDELKTLIKDLDAKKTGLVKLDEGAVKAEKGINEKALDNKTNKGYFTTTETPKGDKVILHVEYHNDGINHLTNGETGKLDFSNPESFKVYVNNEYYTKEENTVSSSSKSVKGTEVQPLDGEKDLTKGFQFDFETDPGNVTYHIYQKKIQTYSLGTYATDVDKKAPEVVSINKTENGRIHVEFSEPVTIEDTNWEKSDVDDETDGRFWIGTLTEDKIYEVKVKDFPGNETTFTVDHKSPIASSISYSTTKPTNGKVKVTVNFDEAVSVADTEQNPGWKYNREHTSASKEYTDNAEEDVVFEDETGNEVVVSVHIANIDKTAPAVTVKDSSIGEKNHYGKLDLKLYDASGIDYVVVNGEKRELTNNTWSDLNDDGVNYKEGENTVEVYDVAGNKTVYTFDYDKTAPTITIKDSSIGEKNHYGKLDLKLYDASGIDYVVVNGEKRELTNNTWSDLNDDGANYKEGENTVEVYDVCGNKTEYTFDYDKTGPEVTVKDSSKGSDGSYSKLDLKLYDASGIDYAVVNGEKRELTNSAWSDLNGDGASYKEGENTVEVYDVCGNKTVFTFVYDTTAPIINAEDKTITKGTDFEPMRGVSATDQGKDITEAIVVEKNEVNTNKTGTYEVSYSVQDKAGNTSVKTIHVTVERESLWDHIVDEVKDITHKVIKAIDDFFDWLF